MVGVVGSGGLEALFSGGATGVGLCLADLQPALGSTTLLIRGPARQPIASFDLAGEVVGYDHLSILAAVPEATSMALTALGLRALGVQARRAGRFRAGGRLSPAEPRATALPDPSRTGPTGGRLGPPGRGRT